MTDFGNPILIGGRYNVLATEIYAQVIGMNDFPAAARMSVVLIVPCLLAYVFNALVIGTRSYVTVSAGAPPTLRPTPAPSPGVHAVRAAGGARALRVCA